MTFGPAVPAGCDTTRLPLAGLRVADFSRVFAGPFCTMLLADLGAEVVKIEDPRTGDDARQFRPPDIGGLSAAFVSLNRGKRSVALDLRTDQGRTAAREIVRSCQVVVENFGTGVMERFGLGAQALCTADPGLVYCTISAYGRTGPFAERAGYDQVCQAESGLLSLTGHPDREPVRTGVPMVDLSAGLFAFGAVCAALREREASGKGRYVEVPLFDTAVCLTSHFGIGHLMTGRDPMRVGNGSVGSQPVGLYAARDGSFVLTVAGDRVWERLVHEVLQRPELARDARFATNQARLANQQALREVLEVAFAQHDTAWWIARMRQAGVPAGEVRSVAQAFASEEVRGRELLGTLAHPTLGAIPNVRSPILLDGVPPACGSAPPMLGEHTEAVLRELRGSDGSQPAAPAGSGPCTPPDPG
ncbi:MAG: CaiB/BaiF CoA transferase family protein [Rubrivivax sp.]